MNWRTRLWGAGLAAVLVWMPAGAQESSGPVKHYYNKSSFRIPIVISEQQMTDLSSLKLFVRKNGGEWSCAATAPPTQKTFSYQALDDGEYWFSIATVDKTGAVSPEDMKDCEPALIVVVDTQAPNIDLQPIVGKSGKTYLQCSIRDANPDYKSLKVQYQSKDGQWHDLESLANSTGILQVPEPSVLSGRMHIHAADLAGNLIDREIDADPSRAAEVAASAVATPPSAAPTNIVAPPSTSGSSFASDSNPAVPPLPPPSGARPKEFPPVSNGGDPVVPPLPEKSDPLPPRPETPLPIPGDARPQPVTLIPNEGYGPTPTPQLPADSAPRSSATVDAPRLPAVTEMSRPALPPEQSRLVLPETSRPASQPELSRPAVSPDMSQPASINEPLRQANPVETYRQPTYGDQSQFAAPAMPIINSTRCRLEFSLEPSPGGVSEVEVWATMDGARSWKIIGGSRDGRSPATVEFPGEGRYGYAFVVKPISGLASSLPRAGEPLDGWIEIDTTRPFAELTGVAPGVGQDAGALVISWLAKDANLGAEPIRLLYSTQPGGPWLPIADHIANTGSLRWPLPRDIGPRVWIRMEVRDRAGNLTGCETPQPVPLEGPRARVRVLNVTPAQN